MNNQLIIIFLLLLLCGPAEAQNKQKYSVSGHIEGVDSGWVWMKQKSAEGDRLLDSAQIREGRFEFNGLLEAGIQSVNLSFNKERGILVLFLEPGKIRIEAEKGAVYYAKVTGTPNNERWGNYVREERHWADEEERMAKLYQASFETKDRAKVKAAEKVFADATLARKQLKAGFLSAPENRYVAACWYRANKIHRMQFQEIDSIIRTFGKGMEANNDYRLMLARRELVAKQRVGQVFGEIALPGPEGRIHALSALKGKWVLVDFWASWCGPCRREGIHVKELYEKYHAAGFEVFGVSIDKNADAWKKAIREDATPWIQVCDGDGKVAKDYGVTVIPHLFLLNPEGKIEAINIRGEELTRKLEAVFQK